MKKLLFLSALLVAGTVHAQDYPTNYFIAPLDTPLKIVGNFGEIRPDHFHSGLDLSTDEQEGVPVTAAADGYVSRIKIASDGYGKALYITHPNGYVTVYGHLQKFTAALNAYVKKIQYERQAFEVDLNLKTNEFRVKKHEVIAYSGSTGGAEGPHLHFEIRNEKTEEPINPMLFGIRAKDTQPPIIRYVRLFPLPENGIVNKTDTARTYEIQVSNGINMLNTLDYIQAYGYVSFGIDAYDQADNNSAELGIYSLELYVDNNLAYEFKYDKFNFTDSRYVNAHIDYMAKIRDHINIQRAFRLPGNHLNIYADTTQSGYQYFTEDAAHDVRFVVKDFDGNTAKLDFQLVTYSTLSGNKSQGHDPDAVLVTNQKGIALHKPRLDVSIPSGAVYQDYYYTDAEKKDTIYLSNIFKVGSWFEALHIPITVGIKPNKEIPDSLKSKAVIAQLFSDGSIKSWGGEWVGKLLSAKTKSFGDYVMMLDTIPPTVVKEYVPADNNTYLGPAVVLKIKDNLSGIASFSGKIDNRWWLFEYDKKSNALKADVSALDLNHSHPIEMTVTDERGNTTTWKSNFWW